MIQVVGWAKHQHFRDRRPVWIKLHVDLLDDPENAFRWRQLSDTARAVLVELWLLCAKGKHYDQGILQAPEHMLADALHRQLDAMVLAVDELVAGGWVVRDAVYQPELFTTEHNTTEPNTTEQNQLESNISTPRSSSSYSSSSSSSKKRGTVAQAPPSVGAVATYMATYMDKLGAVGTNPAEQFVDHFTSNGWKVSGRAPMKSWEAAARNWVRRQVEYGKLKVVAAPAATVADYVPLASLPPGEAEVACNRHKGLLVDCEERLDAEEFETWVQPLRLLGVAPGDVLVLGTGNEIMYEWVRDHLQCDLEAMNGPLRVVYAPGGGDK